MFNPFLLFAAAILTGAGGGTARSKFNEPASSVCSLITRQEAAAALGAPVPPGSEKVMDGPMLGQRIKIEFCFYGTEVSVGRYSLGPAAATLFAKYRQSLTSESDYQNLTGVGDEAFVAKGQIALRKGQTGLIVDVGQARGGGAAEVRKERALALLAVGRL